MPKSTNRDSSSDESEEEGKMPAEVSVNEAGIERIYQDGLAACKTAMQNMRNQFKGNFSKLISRNKELESAMSNSKLRVQKLEQRYQQALEYNNSVSSENEDLNKELKKVKAQLQAAQNAIKALKAKVGLSSKGKKKAAKLKARAMKKKKRVVKRERSSSSSSDSGRGRRRKRSASKTRRKRRTRSRSSSSSSSGAGAASKKKGQPAPPPPAKRNPAEEKAFTFKPGSLGVKCKGVLVHEVTAGGQAESLGIQQNWKIVEVNDVNVNTVNVRGELKKAIVSGKPFTCTFNTKL